MEETKAKINDEIPQWAREYNGICNNNYVKPLGQSFYIRSAPDSIRCAFRPLGIFTKAFGLFPCYDLSFMEKLETNKVRCIHIMDYLYTGFMCIMMTGGALLCSLEPPKLMTVLKEQKDNYTDYYVQIVAFYLTMANGVMSMFIFPKSWIQILNYIEHFNNLDKILKFDKNHIEKHFGYRLCFYLVIMMILTLIAYTFIYILDLPDRKKCYTDYIIVVVTTLGTMTLLIPTAILIFFINSIRIRLIQFNKIMKDLIEPFIPCCCVCESFTDYGNELHSRSLYKRSKDLAVDLEKMRTLHAEIGEIVLKTSNIFGGHLIRDFLHCIMGIILYTYILLFANEEQHFVYRFFYVGLDLFLIGKLLTIAAFCHFITAEGECSRKFLNKVSVLQLSPECGLQVQMFVKKLDVPIQITAAGFFTINRQLITSILQNVTMYFVILIQFKFGEIRNSNKIVSYQHDEKNTIGTRNLNFSFGNDATY